MKNSRIEFVKYALQDQDYNFSPPQYIYHCLNNDTIDILELLLNDEKIKFDNGDDKLIPVAIMHNQKEVVKFLMKHPKISLSSDSPCLLHAITSGNKEEKVEMLKLFLEDGRVDPTNQKNSVAKILVMLNAKEAMTLLLKDPRVCTEANLVKIRKIVEKNGQNWDDYVD